VLSKDAHVSPSHPFPFLQSRVALFQTIGLIASCGHSTCCSSWPPVVPPVLPSCLPFLPYFPIFVFPRKGLHGKYALQFGFVLKLFSRATPQWTWSSLQPQGADMFSLIFLSLPFSPLTYFVLLSDLFHRCYKSRRVLNRNKGTEQPHACFFPLKIPSFFSPLTLFRFFALLLSW